MRIIQGQQRNFEELETWNPGHQDGRSFCILGSILNTFTPQTTSLIAKADLRTLLHDNKLLIEKFIIILTIYHMTQQK